MATCSSSSENGLDVAYLIEHNVTYGAQAAKIADTLKVSRDRAQELYDSFWTGNTALAEFKDSVIAEFRRNGGKHGGFIRGLDGRKLYGRSEHSLVNLKFQSDGAILVKTAMCFLFGKWLPKTDIDYRLLIQQHDEWQCEVRIGQEEEYIQLALASLEKAGQYYNYNVPILGDAKIGQNWAETH